MAIQTILVPDIGDFANVSIIEVLVKPGDSVRVDQSLLTVESDKASMEIPCSHAGTVQQLLVQLGDKVSAGSAVLLLEVAEAKETPPPASVPNKPEAPVERAETAIDIVAKPPPMPTHDPGAVASKLPHASPSVRKFARELGVPLGEVQGSGPKGRILQTDVQTFTRAVMAGSVQTQAAAQNSKAAAPAGAGLGLIPYGPIERKELGRIKKLAGANLLRNAVLIPAVTNHDDADITELEAFRVATNREQTQAKVTLLAFLVKACVAALKKFPDFNSSLDGDTLVYKQYWHIGFAADTPNGLVVPVLKNADQKGILQIAQEMAELADKARIGKLGPSDMAGATFTISSLGGIGGRYFTPIINAPEVAILGVCKSQMTPVWNGSAFVPRLLLPLSLTWDHRVLDGASAARFNAYLGQLLGDFRRVLL
jgi:pyruvate dehydrogenase E2 component (dihydrolipoamide acetyltransferase)